ncbi:MAG: hypothetical protein U1F36_23045 [Planctomycetota bacterium]
MSLRVHAAALLLLAGCASAPRPPAPPAVTADLRYFSGTALGGREPEPDAADRLVGADSLAITCRFDFVPAPPAVRGGEILAADTGLVVAPRAERPLRGVSRLAAGARFGRGEPEDAEGALALGSRIAAIPAGVTAEFFLRDRAPQVGRPGAADVPLGVLVAHRTDGTLSLALILHTTGDGEAARRGELVELDLKLAVDGEALWLALPSPYAAGSSILARLRARTPTDDDTAHRVALAQCLDELRAQGELERTAIAPLTPEAALERTVDAALDRIAHPFDLRRSVVFVAEQVGASVAIDLGLSCDDEVLGELARRIQDRLGTDAALRRDDKALRFALDLIAWQVLAERIDQGRLDDAQSGFLLRVAGEVGRFPGALTAILGTAQSSDDIENALAEQNREFLGAGNPASRVRAWDWLAARALAPKGFDPLGDAKSRRDALDTDRAQREAAQERSR